MKLVLVVGPPRSCTSVTARLLHEKLGVCMGHHLVPGNAGNPLGFYEDSEYVAIIKRREPEELLADLDHGCEIVGVKSPALAELSFERLNPDGVLRCRRPLAKVVASLMQWHSPKLNHSKATTFAMAYERAIDLEVAKLPRKKVWNIYYPGYRMESKIEEELRLFLRGVSG